jgi:hypothetical protein
MAMASEFTTGNRPAMRPGVFEPNRCSVAFSNAPMGPRRVARPNAISSMMPVDAMSTTKIR